MSSQQLTSKGIVLNNEATDKKNFARSLRHCASTVLSICALVVALAGSQSAAAVPVLVFDRGLPTANLNNSAAANRSNFAWADVETLPETPWLPGDDFTLAPGTYTITTIRVWTTTNVGLSLRGGAAGGPITLQSTTYTSTPVTYSNGDQYEKAGGGFLPIFQIDFTVNIPLNGGTTFQYFVDGPPTAVAPAGDQEGIFVLASNAPLSGSTQQGADGILLFLDNTGTVTTWNAATGAGTYCPGCIGADKVSDSNVQVFAFAAAGAAGAQAVPAISGPGLIGLALLLAGVGAFALRRRGG
jgi:hypothetical protein